MKLGRDTGSGVNWAKGRTPQANLVPTVGMGVTYLDWTDRRAGTVTKILADGVVETQVDRAIRTDENGMSESQEYRYEPNPQGKRYYFRLRHGQWEEVRHNPRTMRWNKESQAVRFGERDAYYDFSF